MQTLIYKFQSVLVVTDEQSTAQKPQELDSTASLVTPSNGVNL